MVTINHDRCVMCGKCAAACPTGTITGEATGFRVLLGGRLGRRPRLAMELERLYSEKEVLDIVRKCLRFYKEKSENGERFSHILSSVDQILNPQTGCDKIA